MLPKIKQYKKWSLPSKYSFWSFFIGIPSLVIAIYTLFPKQSVLEQVAQEEYTPKVSLIDVKFEQWLGDSEPFLTLYFKNDSKGPAKYFSVDIYHANKKLVGKKISSSNLAHTGFLTLKPGQILGIPLISMSEVKEIFAGKGKGQNIVGFGLNSDIPTAIKSHLYEMYVKNGRGYYSVDSYPLFVRFLYNGITNTKTETITGFYIYIDNTKKS